jgi:hypothetical protein
VPVKTSGSTSTYSSTTYGGSQTCVGASSKSVSYQGACKNYGDHWGMLSGDCATGTLTIWGALGQTNCGDPIVTVPYKQMGVTSPTAGVCVPEREEKTQQIKKTATGEDIYIKIACTNEGTDSSVLTFLRYTSAQCNGTPYETQTVRSDRCLRTPTWDGTVKGTCESGTWLVWGPSSLGLRPACSGQIATYQMSNIFRGKREDVCTTDGVAAGSSSKLSCTDGTTCAGCHCHNGDSATCMAQTGCHYDDADMTCNTAPATPCVGCHCYNGNSATCMTKPECHYDGARRRAARAVRAATATMATARRAGRSPSAPTTTR